jgi:hypothetical protein
MRPASTTATPHTAVEPGIVDAAEIDAFARSNRGSIEWKRNEGDISRLTRYWVGPKGRAKIGWGTPCDFCRCYHHLFKYIKNEHETKGYCARLHRKAVGRWPGPRGKHGNHCGC